MVTLLALLSPLFIALSFAPVGWWFALPIGYAVFLFTLRRTKYPIGYSLYFSFLANLIILSWSGKYVGALPWLLLAILQALFALPIGILARYTKSIPMYISMFLILEEIKTRTPFGGFGWTRIGFSQVESPLAPIISVGGVVALSAATLFLAYLIITRSRTTALLILAIFIIPQVIYPNSDGDKTLKVIAVQGGVPEVGLNFNSRAMGVLDMHLAESYRSVRGDEDLIIWPENSIDIDPIENQVVRSKLTKLMREKRVPLIAGAIIDKGPYNTAILFRADARVGSVYIKRYLTPFGEYIPLRSVAEVLSPYAKSVNDFRAGEQAKVHRVKKNSISSVICYEIINDGIVRSAARNSSLLVVHTNSATFAGTSEGAQQLAITRLRAIEHNRSIVSISTTGPSAIISPRGEVISSLKEGEVASLTSRVKLIDSRTIADQLGGFATVFTLTLSLSWALVNQFGLRRRRGVS